jgi:hypothetical protein
MAYKDSDFPAPFIPLHDLTKVPETWQPDTFDAPIDPEEPLVEILRELEAQIESFDTYAIADTLNFIHYELMARNPRPFELCEAAVVALLTRFEALLEDPLPVLQARLLDLILLFLEHFPSCAPTFLASNLIDYLVGFLTDDIFAHELAMTLKIFTILNRDVSGFLTTLFSSDPAFVVRLIDIVLAYETAPYLPCLPDTPENRAEVWREYLESGLPLLVEIFSVPDAIDAASAHDYFQQLQVIARQPFAFNPFARAPHGLGRQILVPVIQCFTHLADHMMPQNFIDLICQRDRSGRPYHCYFFRWAQYVKDLEGRDRAFLRELIAYLCPLFHRCIDIAPQLFVDFHDEGLFDLLSMPLFDSENRPVAPWDIEPLRGHFQQTQAHFDGILDLIVTILCKIATGEITDPQSVKVFQAIIVEGLRCHLSGATATRTRILMALAALALHTDDAVKQRIVLDFNCLPAFVDLLDDSPETAALIVRALVVLIPHAIPLGAEAGLDACIDGIDTDELEGLLPDDALDALEQLRAVIGRDAT